MAIEQPLEDTVSAIDRQPTQLVIEHLGPFLTDADNTAYLNKGPEMVLPITWDFAGDYSNSRPRTNNFSLLRWYRSLSQTYSRYGELAVSENRVRILRLGPPRDSLDTLPAYFEMQFDSHIIPPRSPGYWLFANFRPQTIVAPTVDQDEPIENLQNDTLAEGRVVKFETTYLLSTQYYDQDMWQPLSNIAKNNADYLYYDVRTVLIMGNQIALSYWRDLTADSVRCIQQLPTNSGVNEVIANDLAAAEQGFGNENIQEQIDYIKWSLSSYRETLSMPDCGARSSDIQFTGFLAYDGSQFVGAVE